MTLGELLEYLDKNTPHPFIPENKSALEAARNGTHPHELIAQLILAIADKGHCENEDSEVKREEVVNAIGPIRLKYMADDAPVEGFRLIESTILAIDAAFNEEALRLRTK